MNDRARIPFGPGNGTGAEGTTDRLESRGDKAGAEMVDEGPAAKFAAREWTRIVDACIKWVVRIVGWLLIVGGFYLLADGTPSKAQEQRKANEVFALTRLSGNSGIPLDLPG